MRAATEPDAGRDAALAGRHILLLVPHPDDEVVGCAVAIRRAQAAGARVFAVYLTTGVPAASWPWRRETHAARVTRRRAEALTVARRLRIEPLTFSAWPSRELKDHLPEAHALIAYHRQAVCADRIWSPAYEGGHQDHDVTSFLASQFSREVPVMEFSEYNAAGGVQSNQLPSETGAETALTLSAPESAWKAELARVYRSERANLRHVRYTREVLRPLPAHDYGRPPHPGRLFYERFHWVPFRHPRIDFTTPAQVSAALARFAPAPSMARGISRGSG